jgi:hypothetical protein
METIQLKGVEKHEGVNSMLARFLSVSSTNFCNANNNGNANNNNASNSNGVVPDSLARRRHTCGSIPSLEKETVTCGESPKQCRDAGRPRDGSCCQHGSFESVIDPYSLLLAYYGCRKGVSWKGSIQRYEQHLVRNIAKAIKVLEAGGVVTKGFYEFDISERGKRRHIRSVHISERVVQKSLCDNALVPILSRSLIHDNGASLSGKGTSFARNRLKVHLQRHYRKHGDGGYIVLIDCRKYFDSIPHDTLYRMLADRMTDPRVLGLTRHYIDAFGDTGLGLGSQVSQISAIYYLNAVDHYAKEELGLRHYGRYMDDSYFIVPTKEEAREKLGLLERRYAEYGIAFNGRKTHVVKLSRGFTFMKCQYRLLGTGRVLVRPARDGETRMARKIRKFRKNGLDREAVRTAYKTWRGYWRSLGGDPRRMDDLYDNLFGGAA